MIQKGRNYYAEKGNFIVRKADGFIMGEDICLGTADSIENYEEQSYTEESYRAFYESIGMEPPMREDSEEPINEEEDKV